MHLVEAGDPDGAPVLFLHGWPQDWHAWRQVMAAAPRGVRALAIDLPGTGGSTGDATDGSKAQIAALVHQLAGSLGLSDLTLAGHDAGAMVVYAYLRSFGLRRAVMMDAPAPGVDPWAQLAANPRLWHFAFHTVPGLPERLVQGRQRDYFDFFFNAFARTPAAITEEARAAYARAYASDAALSAGFSWYRTFPLDEAANQAAAQKGPARTPLLYLGADGPGGGSPAVLECFRAAGLTSVEQAAVPGAGHFLPEEAPGQVWQLISGFMSR